MLTRRKSSLKKLSESEIDKATAINNVDIGRKRKTDSSSNSVKVLKGEKIRSNDGKITNRSKSDQKSDCDEIWKAIEHIYAKGYVDVVERLKLTFPVGCKQSLKDCSTKHHRNRVRISDQRFIH